MTYVNYIQYLCFNIFIHYSSKIAIVILRAAYELTLRANDNKCKTMRALIKISVCFTSTILVNISGINILYKKVKPPWCIGPVYKHDGCESDSH